MKILLTSLSLVISNFIFSQYKYNMDYNYEQTIEKTWEITTNIVNGQVVFNWEKDIVTSIIIKSLDNDLIFPKVDAFMVSQLNLNYLSLGRYEVIFLDDSDSIMDTKQFQIK